MKTKNIFNMAKYHSRSRRVTGRYSYGMVKLRSTSKLSLIKNAIIEHNESFYVTKNTIFNPKKRATINMLSTKGKSDDKPMSYRLSNYNTKATPLSSYPNNKADTLDVLQYTADMPPAVLKDFTNRINKYKENARVRRMNRYIKHVNYRRIKK